MAGLADLKRRIKSVKNNQKITKAMKLVSAAKFAKSVAAVQAARPYQEALYTMATKALQKANDIEGFASPFMGTTEASTDNAKTMVIVLSTDKGLCGALNSNLFKAADKFLSETREKGQNAADIEVAFWGRKASTIFSKKVSEHGVADKLEGVFEKPTFIRTKDMLKSAIERLQTGELSEIYLVYPEFETVLAQTPRVHRLLPIDVSKMQAGDEDSSSKKASQKSGHEDILVEPDPVQVVESILEKAVYGKVYTSLLDGRASEHGARMTAMDAATRNADEVTKKLTLQYNRARQAAITKELIEIVSGAEAL